MKERLKSKGVHPAGVIVSDKELTDIVSSRLTNGGKGEICVQCDMEDVDKLGLLKVDCLSSKTQTVLGKVSEIIGGIDFDNIPLDDKKVFSEFSKGNTSDIFQFQSELGIETVKKIKPKDFEALSAITALIRPGALDFVDEFKGGKYEPIFDEMKPILKDTRNIILYQEQAMRIAQEIAGFTLNEADDLRKAIGKKKSDEMAKLRYKFVSGAVKGGFDEFKSNELFDIIDKSSNYSFNKSHSIAYTLSSYWSMYLKVYHPIEWSVAELSVYIDDDEKLKRYLDDTIKRGINVLPPDINNSEWGFSKDKDSVRCGLGMVKGVSEKGFAEILKKRPFDSLLDFLGNIEGRKLNKGAIQSLIKVGALDCFGYRKSLFEYIDILKKVKSKKDTPAYKDIGEWNRRSLANKEKESIGFYMSGHPIMFYKSFFDKNGISKNGYGNKRKNNFEVAGMIDNIKEWKSKNGVMAFIDISGFKDYSINVWATSWSTYKNHIKSGDIVIIKGRQIDNGKLAIDVESGDKIIIAKETDL